MQLSLAKTEFPRKPICPELFAEYMLDIPDSLFSNGIALYAMVSSKHKKYRMNNLRRIKGTCTYRAQQQRKNKFLVILFSLYTLLFILIGFGYMFDFDT